MTSNVTVQSVLEKISVDHLECSICTNRFRQPKLLDCLHSFCLQCLQELRQSQDPSATKLICPLCRRETMLKESGVADLPNNFAFSALVEEVTMQEKLLEGQGSEIKCQNCDEENQAISRCMDCDHFLCQECQKAHERMTLMKSHKIYTLAQLRSGEIVYKSKLREEVPKCCKHPDQNLNVYCNSCQQVICTTCSVLDHAKHSLTGLSEAFEQCKIKVEQLVVKVEKTKTELITAIEETCKSRKKLNTLFTDTTKKISENAAKIQMEGQQLLQKTERIYQERIKAIEATQATNRKEVTQTEHKLEDVKQFMNQASCYEILELQQKLLHILCEFTGKKPQQVPDNFDFMDFEEGERSLGRLILEEEPQAAAKQSPRPRISSEKAKWEAETEVKNACDESLRGFTLEKEAEAAAQQSPTSKKAKLEAETEVKKACDESLGGLITEEAAEAVAQQSPRSETSSDNVKWELKTEIENLFATTSISKKVAALSNNKILLYDSWNNEWRHKIEKATSFTIQMKGRYSTLTDVRCIAVSKDDKLHVIDGQKVKVFSNKHELLHQFTPRQGSDSQLTCLAVDDNNVIAVGYRNEEEISLHNPDGSLIRRLPAPRITYCLTMYNHRLIYTTSGYRKELVSVDYSGASVFSEHMLEETLGICCDSAGSIYVAAPARRSRYQTCDILHYSPEGKYIGCVIEGCDCPEDITITSNGDLVVAAKKTIQIYHRP